MKNIGKYLGVLAGFMLLILIFLYNNSAIGTYRQMLKKMHEYLKEYLMIGK